MILTENTTKNKWFREKNYGKTGKIKKSRQEVIYGRFSRFFGGAGVKNGNITGRKIHYIYNVCAYNTIN